MAEQDRGKGLPGGDEWTKRFNTRAAHRRLAGAGVASRRCQLFQILLKLASALKFKDLYAGHHSTRKSRLSRKSLAVPS